MFLDIFGERSKEDEYEGRQLYPGGPVDLDGVGECAFGRIEHPNFRAPNGGVFLDLSLIHI